MLFVAFEARLLLATIYINTLFCCIGYSGGSMLTGSHEAATKSIAKDAIISFRCFIILVLEYKVDCKYKEYKSYKVVHPKALCLKEDGRECYKNKQCDYLLDNFQLYKRERSAMQVGAYAVCRHLEAVLKKRYQPTDYNDSKHAPFWKHLVCSKFKVSIPCKCHECI